MKSLHYDQCYSLYMYNIYSLFHRDETKPTHIIGINSFLFLMQLIYKHSSPNYQHMIIYEEMINKKLVYMCISWNIFNRIHFFAICDAFYLQLVRFYVIFIYDYFEKLTKQLRQTFFFSSYKIYFTLLVNCFNTVVLAEQSLHHNIILEKLDHCCASRICTEKVIRGSHTLRFFHI